ncbi:hypothetical protein RJ639_010576 [Escallonia herrerae]|uniref:Pentatricopeptide repeat-containing protein n=1 Tax=Escallonia herrerae TaxID=1293975 RepID=A0AA89ARZ3_9ASTE|nr:hypothetical protein RJ639_010576 [Escallonia herrerae]
MLANIYASDGRWEEVATVRKLMRDNGLKKKPGCSWVEVTKRVHAPSDNLLNCRSDRRPTHRCDVGIDSTTVIKLKKSYRGEHQIAISGHQITGCDGVRERLPPSMHKY